MTNDTAGRSAEFLNRYGNVGRNAEQLLKDPPTEAQLRMAADACHREVERAIEVIRLHHATPSPDLIQDYRAKIEELEQAKAEYHDKWRNTEERLVDRERACKTWSGLVKRCAKELVRQGVRIQQLQDELEEGRSA